MSLFSTRPRRAPALILAGLAMAALVVTSCSPGEAPAATVNGHDIRAADVRADLEAEAEAADDQAAVAEQLLGQGEGTFNADATSRRLTIRILDQLLADELSRRDVEITEEDRTQAEALLCSGQPGCLDDYPERYREFLEGFSARFAALSRVVQTEQQEEQEDAPPVRTDAELEEAARRQFDQIVQQQPEQLANGVCYQVVSAPDEAAAQQLVTTVQAGGDLRAAAEEAGGEVIPSQCVGAAQEPPPLQGVAPGSAIAVNEAGQALVVQVVKRGQIEFADLREGLIERLRRQDEQVQQQNDQAAQQGAVQELLNELAADAAITVDPRFGSWDAEQLQVVPPPLPEGVEPETTEPPVPSPEGG